MSCNKFGPKFKMYAPKNFAYIFILIGHELCREPCDWLKGMKSSGACNYYMRCIYVGLSFCSLF